MMTTLMRTKEADFASKINHTIPELSAILDKAYGVLIYTKQDMEAGHHANWLIAVSANDTSLGEIMWCCFLSLRSSAWLYEAPKHNGNDSYFRCD